MVFKKKRGRIKDDALGADGPIVVRMSFVIVLLVIPAALGLQPNVTDSTAAIRSAVCTRQYSISCLKLDIVGLVERMGGGAQYQLLPGVYLSHKLNSSKVPEKLLVILETQNSTKELDTYISNRVNEYLSSLTLSIKVLDSSTVRHARKLSEQILTSLMPQETGRKKGYGGALWAAGTVAAVGVSALAAISGKALMTSMLALMLAGAGAMRGGAGGGGGGGGANACKSAALIDAHARTIELDRLAAAEAEFYRDVPRPVYRPSAYGQLTTYGPPQH